MLKNPFVLTILLEVIFLQACQRKIDTNKIIISGNLQNKIKNLEGRTLYLYDLASQIPKDSAIVRNGLFRFELVPGDGFIPFKGMLKFPDTTRDAALLKYYGAVNFLAYLRPLGFINPYDIKTFESNFYVDRGTTQINADKKAGANNYGGVICTIETDSKQNEPHFRDIEPLLPGHDSVKQKKAMAYNVSIIKKYSFSVDLLTSFYYNKEYYPTADLKQYAGLFDDDIKRTGMYKSFQDYFAYRESGAGESPNGLTLQDAFNRRSLVVDRNAKLNFLVFWASWCGPCRREIPALKELLLKYELKGLSLSGISIDSDSSSWKTALEKEKMPWRQFIVSEADKTTIENKYNVHAIPVIFMVDQHNKVVEKIMNLDTAAVKKIEKYLALP
ncbi:MAG: thioredoxin-like domain-containing protein [Bacteroidota bacterium]